MAAKKIRPKSGSKSGTKKESKGRPKNRPKRSARGAKKSSRRGPARKKPKKKFIRTTKDNIIDININPNVMGAIVVALVMLAYYFFVLARPGAEKNDLPPMPRLPEDATAGGGAARVNCGDLDLDIQETIEAVSYSKSGVSRPANPDSKYLVMLISVKNMLFEEKDYSGYRMELTGTEGETYIATSFSRVERLTLYGDSGTEMEYACEELPLASLSRAVMQGREEVTGCKMFHVLEDFEPESITVSDLDGEICTIEV